MRIICSATMSFPVLNTLYFTAFPFPYGRVGILSQVIAVDISSCYVFASFRGFRRAILELASGTWAFTPADAARFQADLQLDQWHWYRQLCSWEYQAVVRKKANKLAEQALACFLKELRSRA
jgi:hypothetical protein